MNKGAIISFIIILAIFIGIFYVIQKNNSSQKTTPTDLTLNQQSQQQAVTPPSSALQQGASPATANGATPPVSLQDIETASYTATIRTAKGNIVLVLYGKDAPKTVQTFITKAKSGFYSGLTFHRVEDWVIQGGDPAGNGTGGGNEPVEFNSHSFVTGALGQASRGDNVVQNDSQFFIVKKGSTFLDGKYTNYGQVTAGMDVVNKIAIGDKILGIDIQKQ